MASSAAGGALPASAIPPAPSPPNSPLPPQEPLAERPVCTVVDLGSSCVKAGLVGEAAPRLICPSIVGRISRWLPGLDGRRYYAGEEVINKFALMTVTKPIDRVTGSFIWDDVGCLLRHVYQMEMRVGPDDGAAIIAIPHNASVSDRERFVQLMFEEFDAWACYLARDAELAMMGSGRLTGLTLDLGHGLSSAVPIYEGHALAHATVTTPLAGQDVTEYLLRTLQQRGQSFASRELYQLPAVKEQTAYVAQDFDAENALPAQQLERIAALNEQRSLTLSTERFACAETLFRPSLLGRDCPSLPRIVTEAIARAPAELRPYLWDNIVLCGGTAQLQGLGHRLLKELRPFAPADTPPRLILPPDPSLLAYTGGAVLGSLDWFPQMWIRRQDYDEEGRHVVTRRCV